jgi:hypothetical protein
MSDIMVPVSISFRLSPAGQRDAVLKGIPAAQLQTRVLNMEMHPLIQIDKEGNCFFDSKTFRDSYDLDVFPSDDDLRDLPETIRRIAERERLKSEAEKAEKSRLKEMAMQKDVAAFWAEYTACDAPATHGYEDCSIKVADKTVSCSSKCLRLTHPEFDTYDSERSARNKQRIAEEEERLQKEQQAATQRLKDWAMLLGSKRVQLLITEGFEWQKIAREEWVIDHLPEGFSDDCPFNVGREAERQKPTLEELEDLAFWRSKCGPDGIYDSVQLRWNFGERDETAASLDLSLRTPDGKIEKVYKFYGVE